MDQFIKSKSGGNGYDLTKMDPETLSNISHDLKEPLTAIKGFSQLLLETQRKDLNEQVYSTIKSIYDHSVLLENRIKNFLDKAQTKNETYDLLLIEDDLATIQLITSYFDSKGFVIKGIVSGSKGIEELNQIRPKAVLLDVRLPDASGYDICQKIKGEHKDIPVYFLTATSPAEVEAKLKSTGADGYISKPFNFSDFEVILKILRKK